MDALTVLTDSSAETPPAEARPSCVDVATLLRGVDVSPERVKELAASVADSNLTPAAAVHLAFERNVIDEPTYLTLLAEITAWPIVSDIEIEEIDTDFTRLIPISYARRHRLIGLDCDEGQVRVVMTDVSDMAVVDFVGSWLRKAVRPVLAPSDVIMHAINEAYEDCEADFDSVLDGAEGAADVLDELSGLDDADLLDSESRAPVIKLVNMILFEAIKSRASDIHIQPLATRVQVRYRIDGVLYDKLEIPGHLLDEVVSRVKVIGQMDIAEKRLAQDGRAGVTIGKKSIDLRISVIPTSHGERVVIRLLDKSARLYELAELGMSSHDRSRFTRLLDRTHGIILVTGPTGSGKSTTLYAALQHLDSSEKNILTLEDPIEYQLPGISQTQVATKKGMTFATGLRAVLRQDPDIIMVGEIRDEETARMAVQSSMTGHLVFSTLHTNDAAGAVTRLLDLGIEPYLVASTLLAVLAQRLVRVVCPNCRQPDHLSADDVAVLQTDAAVENAQVYSARGCDACVQTGYLGRQGIFELLTVDERLRSLIVAREKSSAIKQQAVASGMTTLRQDGIERLLHGQTTYQELSRTTYQDNDAETPVSAALAADSGGGE